MNCVSSSDLSLKYKRFTPLDWQDISIRKFEFVTKTQSRLATYERIALFYRYKIDCIVILPKTKFFSRATVCGDFSSF